MLAEHKLPASQLDDLQKKMATNHWGENDEVGALPDAARQLLEAGDRKKPLGCQEFYDLWPEVSRIRYVKHEPLTTHNMADSLVLNIHEGNCRNTLCGELSKISDEIHTHPQNSAANEALIKKGKRKISASKTRPKPPPQIPL